MQAFLQAFCATFCTTFRAAFHAAFLQTIVISRHNHATLIAQVFHVFEIVLVLFNREFVNVQAFAGYGEARSLIAVVDFSRFQESNPLVEIVYRQLVEVIHTQEIIFWEYVAGLTFHTLCLFGFITEKDLTLAA